MPDRPLPPAEDAGKTKKLLPVIGTGSPLIWLVAPVGIVIGTVGSVSVIKAVYIDKRELTCACVGGGSNAIGLFHPFLDDSEVALYGVEAAGDGVDTIP